MSRVRGLGSRAQGSFGSACTPATQTCTMAKASQTSMVWRDPLCRSFFQTCISVESQVALLCWCVARAELRCSSGRASR